MTLAIVRPAPFLDLAAMLAADGMPKSWRMRGLDAGAVARANKAGGRSWGYRTKEGTCIACAGLCETTIGGRSVLEAWFACRPEAAAHLIAFVRAAQLTLEIAGDDRPIVGFVAQGHRPGQRLARLAGFHLVESSGGFEMWERS